MRFDPVATLFFLGAIVVLLLVDARIANKASERNKDLALWSAVIALALHPIALLVTQQLPISSSADAWLGADIAGAGLMVTALTPTRRGRWIIPLAMTAGLLTALLVIVVGPGLSDQYGSWVPAMPLAAAFIGAAASCRIDQHNNLNSTSGLSTVVVACSLAAALQLLVPVLRMAQAMQHLPLLSLTMAGGLWLLLKLFLLRAMLNARSARVALHDDALSQRLVSYANTVNAAIKITAQSLHHVAAPLLLAGTDGIILFANTPAKRLLSSESLVGTRIEDLCIAVRATSSQTFSAVVLSTSQRLMMLQIQTKSVSCDGAQAHLLTLESAKLGGRELAALLVDGQTDAPGHASGLLDQHFALTAMANGWFDLLGPLDRYAGAGLLWDKLHLLSADDHEIAHLENAILLAPEARGWLRTRDGQPLALSLKKLITPELQTFYHLQIEQEHHQIAEGLKQHVTALGQRMATTLSELRLSPETLAMLAGVPLSQVQSILRGDADESFVSDAHRDDVHRRLAIAMGLPSDAYSLSTTTLPTKTWQSNVSTDTSNEISIPRAEWAHLPVASLDALSTVDKLDSPASSLTTTTSDSAVLLSLTGILALCGAMLALMLLH